jgi:hypothetical protein
MKMELNYVDFEEYTITFKVPEDFMEVVGWKAGSAEIDISQIAVGPIVGNNIENT